jgi:ribosome-associated protein
MVKNHFLKNRIIFITFAALKIAMAKKINKNKKLTKELLKVIVESADEKKANDIITIDLTKIDTRVCDYFVICSADSNTQIESIVENIQVKTKQALKEAPFSVEGKKNAYWVIIDYIHIVVHVMQTQAREYYNLEGLWADAELQKQIINHN